MENFNLKKFLVENKLTTNSKIISEGDEQSPKSITFDLSKVPIGNLEELVNSQTTWDIVNNTYGGNKTKFKNVQVVKRQRTLDGFLYTICRFFIEKNKLSYQLLPGLSKDDVEKMIDGNLSSIKTGGIIGEFENISVGATDNRGYFEIVKV